MNEHTEIKTYSEKDIEEVITNRHTGTWKLGMTRGAYKPYIVYYYNGLKPNWFHRLITRLLLGWKWEDRK